MDFQNTNVAIAFQAGIKTFPVKREGNRFYFENGIIVTRDIVNDVIKTTVTNTANKEIALYDVFVMDNMQLCSKLNRVLISSKSMTGTDMEIMGGKFSSSDLIGFSTKTKGEALLLGALAPTDAFYRYDLDAYALCVVCEREGVPLASGASLCISDITLWTGPSLSRLLNYYGKKSGELCHARISEDIMTGWCSWYYYYGEETEERIISDINELAQSEFAKDIKVIQLDDGWNYSGRDRQWGDWKPKEKFNYNMNNIVDKIHKLGFEAGLWLAPFSATRNSELFTAHPDWFVKSPDSSNLAEPAGLPGGYVGLDLTHPDVLLFIRNTFEDVFNKWGFDYVKLDFLMHGLATGRRYNKNKTTVEAFRDALSIVREVAGDKFILCCGSPMGAAIGICDAMRVGFDVGATWYFDMENPGWKHSNCCIKPAAFPSLLRQWMHKSWWQNDPDCLIVRDFFSEYENRMFEKYNVKDTLSFEEAAFWVRAVWMTGTMALLSEVISKLTQERYNLLRHSFPLNSKRIHILDMYEVVDVFAFESDDGTQVGIFNLGEEDYVFEGDYIGFTEIITGEEFCSPLVLKPHTARVFLMEGKR